MIKVVASWYTLIELARKEGESRLYGTKEQYIAAKEKHEAYKSICLKADEISIFRPRGFK